MKREYRNEVEGGRERKRQTEYPIATNGWMKRAVVNSESTGLLLFPFGIEFCPSRDLVYLFRRWLLLIVSQVTIITW